MHEIIYFHLIKLVLNAPIAFKYKLLFLLFTAVMWVDNLQLCCCFASCCASSLHSLLNKPVNNKCKECV